MTLRSPWTEAQLEGLGVDEHSFQEFKGSAWLADPGGGVAASFVQLLSKQVSAFANGAGGRVFIGIDDAGHVDGGVPVDLKSGGTRAWLEDVVPTCVDPPLRRVDVFEVPWPGPDTPSRILPGHAVYVLAIGPSDDAPHQAHDHRYYLRVAGKSQPLGSLQVQDILRRVRHPRVSVSRISPYGALLPVEADPRGPKALLQLRSELQNNGATLAHHVGAELIVPRPLLTREARERMLSRDDVRWTQTPAEITFFRYLPHPLFPQQRIFFQEAWVSLHAGNVDAVESGALELGWRVYADDAPPREGRQPLGAMGAVREAIAWVRARRTP